MNLRIITKSHAADPEIGFLTKSISKPNGCATAMPTAWELISFKMTNFAQNWSKRDLLTIFTRTISNILTAVNQWSKMLHNF